MDLSSKPSQDEDRIMQRQLYRAGQPQPAPKAPASAPARSAAPKGPSSPPAAAAKKKAKAGEGEERILLMILMLGIGYFLIYGTPSQRKKTFIGLGVVAWLLFLGGVSYCLFLPNLEDISRERMAIFGDKDLTMKEKFEKSRELEKGLTSSQRRQLRTIDRKERTRKNNRDNFDFLRLTPEEQMAQLRKEDAQRKEFFEKMRKEWGNRPKNRNNNNKGNNNSKGNGNNNNNNNNNRGGGPPGGGFGGGGNSDVSRLESGSSPEARAGNAYKRGLAQQAGLNSGFGGRGGPGGGGGKR